MRILGSQAACAGLPQPQAPRGGRKALPPEAWWSGTASVACPSSMRTSTRRRPELVQEFLDAVDGADALLIATPEYNPSLPGGLKNALDWASRRSPTRAEGQAGAVIGASTGLFGAVWAQAEVRKVLKAAARTCSSPSCRSAWPTARSTRRLSRRSRARPPPRRPVGDLLARSRAPVENRHDISRRFVPDLSIFGGERPRRSAPTPPATASASWRRRPGSFDEKGIEARVDGGRRLQGRRRHRHAVSPLRRPAPASCWRCSTSTRATSRTR